MYRLNISAFCVAMWVVVSPAVAQVTTWTDSTGKFSVEAELVAATNDQATLRQSDGNEIQVPLARLSQDSRKRVEEWSAQKGTRVSTANPIVGVTLNATVRSRSVPLNFYGFFLEVQPRTTLIISSLTAHNQAIDKTALAEAANKSEIFALDGGKQLLTGAGHSLPAQETTDAPYLEGVFVVAAPAAICSAPLRMATNPITSRDTVWVADITLPDRSAKQRVAEVNWVECKVLYFRTDGYFIERLDGAPIGEAGVPVANKNHEVVGIVKSLAAKSATELTLHTGHVATLTGLEASLAATTTESK